MRAGIRARPWVFTADAGAPAVRESLGSGGRAMTVLDGHLTVLTPEAAPDRLVRVVDLPMALSGLSHHNVLNALAGRGRRAGPRHRPGRASSRGCGPSCPTTCSTRAG
jgi:cyanophycin synthetase